MAPPPPSGVDRAKSKFSLDTVLPAPLALEGVKSRQRAIFKADEVVVKSPAGIEWMLPTVTVTLQSRIVAVGEGAREVAALVCGDLQEESGRVARHKALLVVTLAAHLAGPDASAEQHEAAIAAALQKKPQVVVAHEMAGEGGAGWAKAYHRLLRSKALASYKGAFIAVSEEPTFAVRRHCSEQWRGVRGQVLQQTISGRQVEVFEDVLRQGAGDAPSSLENSGGGGGRKRGKQDEASPIDALVEEARTSSEYWFEEDVVTCCRKKGWLLTLLADNGALRGFVCYRFVKTDAGHEFVIERIGVPRPFCKRGFGAMLMRWVLEEAVRKPHSECCKISCDALSNVVHFYELHGFKATGIAQPQEAQEGEGDEDEEANVHMERENASIIGPCSCSAPDAAVHVDGVA